MNKKLWKFLILYSFLFIAIFSSCKQEELETVEVKVTGMVCNSCEKAIETKIASIEGVKSVKAVQKKGTVTIELSSKTNLETVTKEIEGLHYKIEGTPIIKSAL